MSLARGDKLGPYDIVELIGKGGMGEVYRAHDPRVGRDVAIKVSAERFSERFAREGRAIAALSHPHICTLYDVGPNYLVMELVEGITLAEQIKEGPIPLEESLKIARQIAEALEAAHERGVTHRDLKPANVKIKPDGTVKVLDFGLAKIGPRTASGGEHSPEESPTLSMAATQAGVILGTAAYMSPEQARGKEVDKRADIWAFGVVLYEVVTGKKLFHGDDLTETLAAVVRDKADLSAAPSTLRRMLTACLEKDPKNRLRDIADVWKLLEETRVDIAAQPEALRKKAWLWPSIAGACAAATVAVLVLWAPWRAAPSPPLRRLEVDLGAGVALRPVGNGSVVISPDGTRLAYVASVGGGLSRLYIRRMDEAKATELPGTVGAQGVFFSPDSQWIGFAVGTKLNKISVEGGAVVPLGDIGVNAGATWALDGTIVVGGALNRGLQRFSPAGGQPDKLTDLVPGQIAHAFPQILPDGKSVMFTVYGAPVTAQSIDVVPLGGGVRKIVARGGTALAYVPTGHLLFINKSTLFAVPFDLKGLETRGTPVPVLDDVGYVANTNAPDLSLSRNGTLVYRAGASGVAATSTLEWIEASGKRSPLLSKPGVYSAPRISPDGRKIALLVNEGGSQDVQVYDPQRDSFNKLTFNGANVTPMWNADGRFVLFGNLVVKWTRADGAGQPAALLESKNLQSPWSFTTDGKRLAYLELGTGGEGGATQIYTVPVDGENGQLKAGTPEPFLKSTYNETFPQFSSDGHWLAYVSDESGQQEVNVRPFPAGQGGRWKISTNGGTAPHWSRASREILYQAGDQIMAVPYTANGDSFIAEKPKVRVESLGGTDWDVAPDGRILVVKPAKGANQPAPGADHTVVFLDNFFDELKRRVPVN
jgi:Tol biopolymer transport system component/predicted Ser/Thr protein kinase